MDPTQAGPVDVVLLRFPGNDFNGGIAGALLDPVSRGVIRVLDVLFVFRDTDGTVGSIELADLGPELGPVLIDTDGQLPGGLLDAEDVDEVAKDLEAGSSMAVLAVENLWAVPFIQAVRASGGELVDQARVPSEVVDVVRDASEGV